MPYATAEILKFLNSNPAKINILLKMNPAYPSTIKTLPNLKKQKMSFGHV